MAIQFIDLQAQRQRIAEPLNRAVLDAVESGKWILGPQTKSLEAELAEFAGVKHAVTCANGTDALLLVLRAWDIGPGDAVFVPAFTFAATAEVVALVGASPVFVDVHKDTFNLDPASLQAAISLIRSNGQLTPRAVIAVDLFGQPADYDSIEPMCKAEGLKLLGDTAQGFGGRYKGRCTGNIGDAAATSFFPAKPLGCFGDGGATFTNDDELANLLRSIRVHGQGSDKYENVRIGLNSRLDTIQAAILLEKLKIFPDEIVKRNTVADRYNSAFANSNRITTPHVADDCTSTWAQYTIQVENRDALQERLKSAGIPTAVYYPIPLNKQGAYKHYPFVQTPTSDELSKTVISLPMHPYLDVDQQDMVIKAVLENIS